MMSSDRAPHRDTRSLGPVITAEAGVAYVLVFVIALRYRLPLEISSAFVAAVVALPVTIRVIRRYRGAMTISVLSVAAAISGLILTATAAERMLQVNEILALQKTIGILSVAVVTLALLWARSVIGIRNVVLVFAVGMIGAVAVAGVDPSNPWKASFSLPLALLLLSLPWVYARRLPQAAIAIALAGVSAAADSRSAAALLLIAAALTFSQARVKTGVTPTITRVAGMTVRLALIGVGAFYAIQAAFVEGALGEAVQERTESQLQAGSVLAGGRPEMGATLALVGENPWGFGSGVILSQSIVRVAKGGMAALGYDPNNGYVERYMFGTGIEVHSLVGDFWLMFGLAGLALAIAVGVMSIYGLIVRMSLGIASTVVVFLVLRLTWDLLFSPYLTSLRILPLVLAVALPLAVAATHRERATVDRASMLRELGTTGPVVHSGR